MFKYRQPIIIMITVCRCVFCILLNLINQSRYLAAKPIIYLILATLISINCSMTSNMVLYSTIVRNRITDPGTWPDETRLIILLPFFVSRNNEEKTA
jgi:hypothetical protein